jgi:hypothetical protein
VPHVVSTAALCRDNRKCFHLVRLSLPAITCPVLDPYDSSTLSAAATCMSPCSSSALPGSFWGLVSGALVKGSAFCPHSLPRPYYEAVSPSLHG